MRILSFFTLILGLLAVSCNQAPESTATTTDEAGNQIEFYGEAFDLESKKALTVPQLVKQMEGKQEQQAVRLEGKILATCAKKGCWMDVAMPGDHDLKVRFKDYGFFVPTKDQEGKTAIMEGMAFVDTMDVDLLRHYAEDAGKSKEEIEKITEPEVVLAFEATGVAIK